MRKRRKKSTRSLADIEKALRVARRQIKKLRSIKVSRLKILDSVYGEIAALQGSTPRKRRRRKRRAGRPKGSKNKSK